MNDTVFDIHGPKLIKVVALNMLRHINAGPDPFYEYKTSLIGLTKEQLTATVKELDEEFGPLEFTSLHIMLDCDPYSLCDLLETFVQTGQTLDDLIETLCASE